MNIITYKGATAPENCCRKIKGQYYIIGDPNVKNSGECYLINDTYYRETSPKIAWDSEMKAYNLIEYMVKGYTDEGNIGYFTPIIQNNYLADDMLYVQNDDAIIKNKLSYDYHIGKYVSKNPLIGKPQIFDRRPNYNTLRTDIYSLSEYNIEEIERIFKAYPLESSPFDKFLNGFTYGLEIETEGGYFPENLYYKFGCVPLKDGSIQGTEITTLKYPPNFKLMSSLFDKVNQYCLANQNNSLHVNISGFKNTPEFRVAMYLLYYRLQQEILQFTPIYKRELEYLTGKRGGAKDHCKPMESLGIVRRYNENELASQVKSSDIIIFKFLNEGIYDVEHNIETRKHVRTGAHKWDMANRYYALNMIPLYFGNIESSRIEYRLHSGTVNKYKALAWIFITAAITKFVENNTKRILIGKDKITLDDILTEMMYNEESTEGIFLYNYIKAYIANRTENNLKLLMSHRHGIYGDEFSRDNSFQFEIAKQSIFNFGEAAGKPKKKGA